MTRFQAWLLHISVLAITVTGGVYAWMRYAMTTDDPFAVANHAWQPHMLHLHVLGAPIAVFALGLVFSSHIWPKYEARVNARRKSGLGALWMIAPMVLSGYLMQVLTNETALFAMKITHWVTSGAFVLAYLAHQSLQIGIAVRTRSDRVQGLAQIPASDDARSTSGRRGAPRESRPTDSIRYRTGSMER